MKKTFKERVDEIFAENTKYPASMTKSTKQYLERKHLEVEIREIKEGLRFNSQDTFRSLVDKIFDEVK